MAFKMDYELDSVIYPDAYVRIHKVRTAMVDYEKFTNVDDDDNVDQILDWETRCETSATAYVWIDEDARKNRAQPMKWFTFDFDFDFESDKNVYTQAYDALKTAKEFSDVDDV